LEKIKIYFNGVGGIYEDGKSLYKYSVRSIKDLEIIINHFDSYPLITQKWADYQLFKLLVNMLLNKEHLTQEGLDKVMSIKASLNKGLSPKEKVAFPNIVPVERPLLVESPEINPYWLAGFTDGEGSFLINLYNSSVNKLGERTQLRFTITQHRRDIELLKSVITFLDCGIIAPNPLDSTVKLVVSKFSDITEKILPFFDQYLLNGVKSKDFEDFSKVAELIKSKSHLTQEGLEQIRKIKLGMNSKRVLQ